jgi:hypothetical protein
MTHPIDLPLHPSIWSNIKHSDLSILFLFVTPQLSKTNINEFCKNDWKSLSDLGKSNVESKPIPIVLPITNRFASFEAQALHVPVDFPLFQRLALSIVSGHTKIPGIKIHDTRIIRLMEVLIHSGSSVSSWRTRDLHQTLLKTFSFQPHTYTLTQLRYDLRKMKAHGLIQRDLQHYCYHLTEEELKVSLLFLLFHKRICGPIANSLFQFRPSLQGYFKSKLETAYHKADKAIQNTIDLLAA